MDDPIETEALLAEALRLTADAPEAWIEAAVLIPSTLGDLAEIDRLACDPAFRARYRADAAGAVADAGLDPSPALMAALREHLGS